MKTEIDYVVEQCANNGMIVIKTYENNRLKMLEENPNVDRGNFIVIEFDDKFCRFNEVRGRKMKWI